MKRTVQLGKKSLSLFLAVLMVVFTLPLSVFANELNSNTELPADDYSVSFIKDIFEIEDLRDETVKHFRLEDGSYIAAQYDKPIHYLDENGEWQDIDNTLAESGSEISTGNARVKFAKKITGNEAIFTLHENNRKITISLDGAIKKTKGTIINSEDDDGSTKLQKMLSLENLTARVLYEDILDGVDLEYIVDSYDIKENIIVKEKADAYSYTFTMQLNNLDAALDETGRVLLTDSKTEEIAYIIPAPTAYDADDVYAERDLLYYTLIGNGNGKYSLTVTVDADWMNSDDRAYPVVVDPPISVPSSTVTDLDIDSTTPDICYANDTSMCVGQNWKSYWKTSTLPYIPSSAYITRANISLYSTICSVNYVGVYQVTTDWDSTLTWNKTISDDPQGAIASFPIDYNCIDGTSAVNNRYNWDITQIVRNWYAGYYENYGIAFQIVSGTTPSSIYSVFKTSESSNDPQFTISYKDMKGVEDYWTFGTQSAGLAGNGYVNYATGNLTFSKSLLSTTDSLMAYSPAFVYNSALANDEYEYPNAEISYWGTYMPRGFKLSINETIIQREYTSADGETLYMYILSDADGTEHYFLPVTENGVRSTTKYQDEDGLQLILDTSANTTLTITDNSKNVRYYEKLSGVPSSGILGGWYLSRIADSTGNEIVFGFETGPRPNTVSIKPNGSTQIVFLKIAYNSSYMPYIIWNETSKEAMLFRYSTTYDGDITNANTNYLRKVEYAHSTESLTLSDWQAFYNNGSNSTKIVVDASAEYTYDSNGNLTIAKDNLSGYEIRYTYSSAGKVTNVQEYAGTTPGQALSYTYRTGYTLVQSSGSDDIYGTDDDLVTRYIFDNEGRVSSMYTIDNSRTQVYGATTGVYEEQDNVKNNLKSTVVIGGSTSNYLLNGGFEKSTAALADHWSTPSGNVSFVQTEIPGGGDRMAKIAVNANSVTSISQYTFLKAGEYTLSASVLPLNCDNGKLFMKAESLSDASNIYIEEVPLSKKDVEGQSDFGTMTFTSVGENFKISFIVESGTISNTNVSVAIDNVMLEENIGASDYSMIQCGNFEAFAIDSNGTAIDNTADFWTNQDGTLAGVTAHEPFGHAGYVNGEITEERYIKQTVYTAPEEYLTQYDTDPTSLDLQSKTFIVSGFGKGAGQSYSENSRFGLRVEVYYYQGNGVEVLDEEPKYLEFEHDCADWQFVCGSFDTVEGALISRIVVYCDYSYQLEGMAIFDEIAFFESNDDSVVKYTYYANGLLKTQKSGYVTEIYKYNDDRQITRVANSLGYITDYVYQDDGITVDHEISYSYSTESITIDDVLTAVIETAPATKTSYTYNDFGQMTQAETFDGDMIQGSFVQTPNAKCVRTKTDYITTPGSHVIGALVREMNDLGVYIKYFYDETNGRLLATVNLDEQTGTCYTYDAIGNITSVLPATIRNIYEYLEVTDSNSVEYTYNAANLLDTITTESTEYKFVYDVFGNTDSVSIGTNEIVSYEYNSYNGKLHTINYANGFSVEYVYDKLENISEVWYNNNGTETKAYEYHYTAYGQLARFDNLLTGKSIAYKYDNDGRMIGFVEYDTDNADNLFSYTVFYDEKSRVSSVSYDFDYAVGTTFANADIQYEYFFNAPEGTLDEYKLTANGGTGTVEYTYDGLKRLSGKTFTVGEDSAPQFTNTLNYTFLDSPWYNDQTSSFIGTVTSQVNNGTAVTTTYEYDYNGNITKIALSNGQEYRYVYDDLGQLLREDNTVLGKTYVYTYDNAGNILTKSTYALTAASVEPTSPISTYNYGYTDANWGDKLTSYRGVSFTYDAIGNPLTYYNGSNYSFTWENGRQLATLTKGSNSLSFEYNDEGIRTQKTVNGVVHTYHLSDSRIIAEEWGDNLLLYLYDAEGSPVGMQYRKSSYAEGVFDTYWFEKNLQGDIVAVYDAEGIKLASYTYDAWGNCTITYHNGGTSTTATYNPFRYRGYYLDTETGFYYLNSRYYDPVVGRFVTADKFATIKATPLSLTDKNLFAYCDNNPVTRTDNGGAFWDTFFDVASLVGSVAEVITTPTNVWAWAGLIGDVVDLVPFVSGVGEVVDAVRIGAKLDDAADVVDDVIDAAKALKNASSSASDLRKATGSYEIIYESGMNYVGKGGFGRAIQSAEIHAKEGADRVISICWKKAPDTRTAFVEEFIMQTKNGVNNPKTYNRIWSPGRKYSFGN